MLPKKIYKGFFSLCTGNFKSFINDELSSLIDSNEDKKAFQKAINTAIEQVNNQYIIDSLTEISNDTKDFMNEKNIFTEKQFHELFDNYFTKYRNENPNIICNTDIRYELFERFKIFVNRYCNNLFNEITKIDQAQIIQNKYNNQLTEKLLDFSKKSLSTQEDILEKTTNIEESLKKIVTNEDLEKHAQASTELFNRLLSNFDSPVFTISSLASIDIRQFESKYLFWNNTFDFSGKQYGQRDCCHVLSLVLNNVGKCLIENLEISDLSLTYCKQIVENEDTYSSDELLYSYFPYLACEIKQSLSNTLNILPMSNQKINLVFDINDINNQEEFCLDDEVDEKYEFFTGYDGKYHFDLINLEFKATCKYKNNSNTYNVSLFLSNKNPIANCIEGSWEPNYILITLNE